jgi:hypothetical protein
LQNYRINKKIDKPIYFLFEILIFCLAHYLLILSVSRAGAISAIVLDICYFKNTKDIKAVIPIMVAAAIMIIYVTLINPHFIEDRWELRRDEITQRGIRYSMIERVLEPLKDMQGVDYLIGKGSKLEPETKSSVSIVKRGRATIEVHNMFGNVFKCYGLIGLFFFCLWIAKLLKISCNIKDGLWILIGLMLYNMAGNGIRFRSFWIFLAFFLALINQSFNQRDNIGKLEFSGDNEQKLGNFLAIESKDFKIDG